MTTPDIPDDADEDLPPANGAGAELKQVHDPEGPHRRKMARSKLKFAIVLVASCMAGIVLFALIEYIWPSENGSFAGATDTLKLVATTALGFVFGRSMLKD